MVAKTATRPASASTSGSGSNSKTTSSITSSSSSATASKPRKSSAASLVQSSAKKSLKKNKKNNKFRDSAKRELLDGQTSNLFTPASAEAKGGASTDPFSYNLPSRAEVRRTRRQVDEAADALDALMKSF
ncbi:uncharacterized protein UTRI_01306_B [Ustilago trichophora]|uniref:Uncharacterized protein n=1 Tax=Ustilago trichophora TaxID=86804 RepID=A0A5C3DTN4_9BASI|nr:uncharacterized protein UTRI_01306_B [Ustilago trichophora]